MIQESGKVTGTGGNIVLISFDSTKAALEKVKAGIINADVECNPFLGEKLEQIIQDIEAGRPIKKEYYVRERVFTQKNVMSVLNDWEY